ncbi:M20/M25/M40 family metallo-hydrolase [Sphingomonas sinipercae]|uniref:Carboxypeptidase Q n=1 Tax=Sphingomonas sinipercae TaxID=2714944 RepID=A0A6G7ZP83_9SPHN|nr:M20/M25/M40 family metallo-hydrolase [Sphingomonas sinipercae]QIL02807.1 M20/M25/M40 family metallo-hydrolase [Sphingomonas sinipercae]
MRRSHLFLLSGAALVLGTGAHAQSADSARIIDEGMNRSQVMLTASQLMDGIGSRLTNSRNLDRAEEWALAKLRSYGLANVRREPFEFGRGWNMTSSKARMVEPRVIEMTAIPVAWTPGTAGTLRAPIVVAPISKVEHLAAWRGKLSGKIVLLTMPGVSDEPKEAAFKRLSDKDIGDEDNYNLPTYDPETLDRRLKRFQFAKQVDAFLKAEGALAWVRKSYRDGKLLHGEGYSYLPNHSPALPGFELAAEDYRRLARLAKTGPAPVIELMSDAQFDDSDHLANNIIAEIPGTDPRAGYVMAGAHFDSWIAGDGAADNGAGSAVVIEAARILRTLGVRPKRTIRFALWEGEEQGLLGSRAYIEQHLVNRATPPGMDGITAYFSWLNRFPLSKKPGYDQLKAYFNMDNGSGKFRGIYAEGNAAAVPLLSEWMAPFNSLGAQAVVAGKTGGTDHVFMQAVGLQGYQFIQDPLDYESRVHHSSIDTLDHLRADDMRQAAVVMAGMLLAAANSDREIPRPPLPTQPLPTDPFAYVDPDE